MKAVLIAVGLVLAAASLSADFVHNEFQSFTKKYDRVYSRQEFPQCYQIFKENLEKTATPWESANSQIGPSKSLLRIG